MINESHRVIDEVAGRLKVAAEQLQQYAVSDHSIPLKLRWADFCNWCMLQDAIDLESLEGDEEPLQTEG